MTIAEIDKMTKAAEEALEVGYERAQVPEEIFRNGFAQYLHSSPDITNDLFFAKWTTVAGSPYAEVDIIDSDGNVVDVVPPLMDRGVYVDNKSGGIVELEKSITDARIKDKHIPGTGTRNLGNKLIGELKTAVPLKEAWTRLANKYAKNENEELIEFDDAPEDDDDGFILEY